MVFHLYKPLVCPLLPLVRIARDCRPGINVLAWDDMMREATVEQVRNLQKLQKSWIQRMVQVRFRMLDTLLHPVVWSYGEQLALEPSLLARYAQAGTMCRSNVRIGNTI